MEGDGAGFSDFKDKAGFGAGYDGGGCAEDFVAAFLDAALATAVNFLRNILPYPRESSRFGRLWTDSSYRPSPQPISAFQFLC